MVIAAAAQGRGGSGALAFMGFIMGPSAGYFYAEKPGRALTGIGIRLRATSLMIAGAAVAMAGTEDIFSEEPHNRNDNLAGTLFIAGGGILVIDSVVDIAGVGSAIKVHNREPRGKAISVSPLYIAISRRRQNYN